MQKVKNVQTVESTENIKKEEPKKTVLEIDFSEKQLKFLLEMINVLNFPGKEVETVFDIKGVIVKKLKQY